MATVPSPIQRFEPQDAVYEETLETIISDEEIIEVEAEEIPRQQFFQTGSVSFSIRY